MTDESGVLRTVSAISGVSAAGTTASETAAAVVSESLEGLVSAVDELKKSMGLGEQVEFAAVEQFVMRLRHENEEFRQFAEEAILSAQRLRDERDELQQRLDQGVLDASMGAALAETQKLKDVVDEFEKDLYERKVAEAEARAAEAEALRERISELEEENAGLTQTLNEFRATTQQLQRLQSHEVRRLQAVEAGGLAVAATAGALPPRPGLPPLPEEAGEQGQRQLNGGGAAHSASGGSSPGAGSGGGGGATPSSKFARSPGASPRAAAAAPSAQGAAAARIALQLEEVAGGADSGLLAEAAAALRALGRVDAELQQAQQENARLRAEVGELNDTMFSKTFKPPSAWAEREIKYKSEKKYWEEQQKAVAGRLAALSLELEAHRGASGANQLEERIQELEAALLQAGRERDSVRAQLHELQLSLRTEGEFGAAGRRLSPYKGPLGAAGGGGHEVQLMVDQLEHGGIGMESPEAVGAAAAAGRLPGLQAQLAAASTENQHLRRQLADHKAVAVPPSLHGELGQVATAAAVAATAAELEARLARAEAESQALRRRLPEGDGGGEGAAGTAAAAAEEAVQQAGQQEAAARQAEAAGEEEDAARLREQAAQLHRMAARLRAAEEEKAGLRAQLADLAPVRLHISAAAAAAAAEDAAAPAGGEASAVAAAAAEEVAVPAALQAALGATAPAAAVAAVAAELERRLGEAEREAGDLQGQVGQVMELERAVQAASARLDAAASAAGGGDEMEELRRQLAAAQAQKAAAQRQLWQLTELQEQLQRAEAERRRLAAQVQQAQPVRLQLAVAGGGGAEEPAEVAAQRAQQEAEEPAELASLRAELAAAQLRSAELRSQLEAAQGAAAPVVLALRVGGPGEGEGEGGEGGEGAAGRLAAAEAEAARLRQQLADLQPVRLQLQLAAASAACCGGESSPPRGGLTPTSAAAWPAAAPPPSPGTLLLAREASDVSLHSLLQYSGEQASALAQERAAADAAWRDHQKASDVPSLLRARAELETRCQLLEAQLGKMQGELAVADEAAAVMEEHLDGALQSGDVSGLTGLRDKLSVGSQSLSRRMFKRQGKASPSKDTLKNTVHEMQGALASSEEERNALKRQLAKLSKKYQQVTQQQAHTAGIIAGAAAMQADAEAATEDSPPPPPPLANGRDEDGELELLKMREENQMLMEHVVMVKVRQAEMEGEYLEAKRQLLRTREKNVQLARKLGELREAAERGEPLPLTPRHGAAPPPPPPEDAAPGRRPSAAAEQPMRKGLRIPGL